MRRLILTVLTCAVVAAPAMAATYTVSKMKYKNSGAYDAYFDVQFKYDGSDCKVYLDGESLTTHPNQGAVEVDLLSSEFKTHKSPSKCLDENGKIRTGTRVWGFVNIKSGENKSCKTNDLLKVGADGQTVKYETSGQTQTNNRCDQKQP